MNVKKRGKISAFTDNVVMFCLTISYTFSTEHLVEKRSAWVSTNVFTNFVTFIVAIFFTTHCMYFIQKRAYFKSNQRISEEKKYIVGSYYLLVLLCGLTLSLLSNNYLITHTSKYLSIQAVNQGLNSIYIHYAIGIIFGIIRLGLAFDYYEAIYYQEKQSSAALYFFWLLLVINLFILIYCS